MNNEELIKRFEDMSKATQSSINQSNQYERRILDNTAIAIAYIESESNALKEYAKTKHYNKNSAVLQHLQSNIGTLDDSAVEAAIRKHLGYISGEQLFNFIFIVFGVMPALIALCINLYIYVWK